MRGAGWIAVGIGVLGVLMNLGVVISHWGFGEPVHEKYSGRVVGDAEILRLVIPLGGLSLVALLIGLAILRASRSRKAT